MKLLIATGIYPPSVGGPATYAKLLFDELPKQNIEVKIFSYDEVRKYPKRISHLIYLLKLIFKIVFFSPDIIYAQDPVSVGYPTMIASKILGKKYTLRLGGDFAWEQGVRRFGVTDTLDEFVQDIENKKYKSEVIKLKSLQKKVAENAEKIIVPSNYLKSIVEQWGIDAEKIKVIYNAFDSSDLTFSQEVELEEETLSQFNRNVFNKEIKEIKEKELIIFSAGRLVPWKGFGTLISIMPNLLKKFPNIKLQIAGEGSERIELERLIKEGKLENNVELLGSLDKVDLFNRIQLSRVFVLNTGYEGFSHQLLEVLHVGIPIITTRAGGNPEIIKDKENGLFVEYNNKKELETAIVRIILDEDFAENLVKRGKEVINSYTKEKMIKELLSEL